MRSPGRGAEDDRPPPRRPRRDEAARRDDRVRRLIAVEAAQLMYEEGIKEYRDAKRKAAKRHGPEHALSLGSHLPTNAEIHAELQLLIASREGPALPERVRRLRLLAARELELLAPFRPYLVGSVLSGAVTARSDIDLHLFADEPEEVAAFFHEQGIAFDQETVQTRHGGEVREYTHFYREVDGVTVECTVYPPAEIRRPPKSSITGRAMERADLRKLRRLLAEESPEGQPPVTEP